MVHIAIGSGIGEENYTVKLEIFHTVFNVIGVILMFPLVGKIVKFLEKHIKQKSPEIEKPVFLTEAALAYSQSAISALVKESKHLFDNVFKIMAHGLGYHRAEVLGKKTSGPSFVPISTKEIDKSYYRK